MHPYQVPPEAQIALGVYQRCFVEYREALKDNSDRVLAFQKCGELQAARLRLLEVCKDHNERVIEGDESAKDEFMEAVHNFRGQTAPSRKLEELPLVRHELHLRKGPAKWAFAELSHVPRNLVAARAHLAGHEPAQPCAQCQRGRGPFTQCIVAERPSGDPFFKGSCTNCCFTGNQHGCSLKRKEQGGTRGERVGAIPASWPRAYEANTYSHLSV